MASVRKVDYFVLRSAQAPGEGARLLKLLRKERINLLALTAFPAGARAQVDFVPADSKAFLAAAKKHGMEVSAKKTGFLVQGVDRPGALVNLLDRLGKAGINVTALDAVTAGGKRFGAIFWVKPEAVTKTARLLKAKAR